MWLWTVAALWAGRVVLAAVVLALAAAVVDAATWRRRRPLYLPENHPALAPHRRKEHP